MSFQLSRVSGTVADRFGSHLELEVSGKMTHFDEIRKIFLDFESKIPIFYSKVHKN